MQPTRLAMAAFAAALLAVPPVLAHQVLAQTRDQARLGDTVPSGFVYQGVLERSGQPVTEPFMASFVLYPVPSGSVGPVTSEIQRLVTPDNRGLFSVELDFGLVFDQAPLYLQISVLNDSGGPTVLTPRTRITAAPFANYALEAPVPTLAQVTDGRLVASDGQGNLQLSVEHAEDGITIVKPGMEEENNIQTRYAASGLSATQDFSIDSQRASIGLTAELGNIGLSAEIGNIDADAKRIEFVGDQFIRLRSVNNNQFDLSPMGMALSALSVGIDSTLSTNISAQQINLDAQSVFEVNSPIIHLDSPSVFLGSNQFIPGSILFSGTLSVTGGAAKPGGGPWSVLSDARQKKNITPLSGSLETLLSLRPVRYEYNDPTNRLYAPGVQTGFVAQEVRDVLPGWVDESPDGTLMLTPRGFEAMVVDALRELQARREDEIDALKSENKELRQRLERIETLIGAGSR